MVSNAVSNAVGRETVRPMHLCQGSRRADSEKDCRVAAVFRFREVVRWCVCRRGKTTLFLIEHQYKNIRVCQVRISRRWPKQDGCPAPQDNNTNQGAAHPRLRCKAQEGIFGSLVAKELLTVNAVAEELKVSRSTVYRLIAARELLTVRVRGCRRVSRTALDRYINGLERSARLADVVISYDE